MMYPPSLLPSSLTYPLYPPSLLSPTYSSTHLLTLPITHSLNHPLTHSLLNKNYSHSGHTVFALTVRGPCWTRLRPCGCTWGSIWGPRLQPVRVWDLGSGVGPDDDAGYRGKQGDVEGCLIIFTYCSHTPKRRVRRGPGINLIRSNLI